jgi:hypothetical protein
MQNLDQKIDIYVKGRLSGEEGRRKGKRREWVNMLKVHYIYVKSSMRKPTKNCKEKKRKCRGMWGMRQSNGGGEFDILHYVHIWKSHNETPLHY